MRIVMKARPVLCEGCHFGGVARREDGQVIVRCRWFGMMPADLATCSRYQSVAATTFSAWSSEQPVHDGLLIDLRPPAGGVYK